MRLGADLQVEISNSESTISEMYRTFQPGLASWLASRKLRQAPFFLVIELFALSLLGNSQVLCAHLSRRDTVQSTKTERKQNAHSSATVSPIQFENVIQTSKVKFALKNSISPKRYTFETMVGGVALFDYNNDGLLDIFFT